MIKKIFLGFGVLIVLFLAAMVITPIIFKDDIQKALDEQIAANIDAKVFYDTDAFGLSLFKSFPSLSVSVGKFGVAGNEPFENDTLAYIGNFRLDINVMSAIKGERIIINNILLDEPAIKVRVLADGQANYDIAKASAEEAPEEVLEEAADTTSTDIQIAIKKWEIRNGDIAYIDQAGNMAAYLEGLNHEGSGDFTLEVYDITTSTIIEKVSFLYEGTSYLSNKTFKADLILNMDLANMKFIFKENSVSLNAFGFGFDGFVSMPTEDIEMDITFAGKEMDLKGLLSLIPGAYQEYLDGITAGGQIGFDGYVKGVYNESSMPQVAANLQVDNGAIKYAEYPVPIEELTVRAGFDYPSADLRDFSFTVDNFSMLVDGEKSSASLLFKDLEDFFWDFQFEGNLDIGKLTKIIPVEGMDLEGKVNAALQTSGRMSDVEAERYDKLPTSGNMSLTGFKYTSEDLPQGFGIENTAMQFNPEAITLSNFKGNAGRTDLNMSGEIRNYMEYALGEDATLVGRFDFSSSIVDINEWMVAEDTVVTEEPVDTTALEVVRIPTNIDFVLASSIDKMLYDNLSIDDFAGGVIIQDGAIRLDKVNFNLLSGYFEMNGAYETVPEDPLYNFDFQIKELSIPDAYNAFSTVQQLAPFTEDMTGKFSTGLQIGGSLLQDMSPDYNTMQGFGMVSVIEGALNNVELLSQAQGFTGGNFLGDTDGTVSLKDVLMQVEIKDGRVYVKPFQMNIGKYKVDVEGSNGVAGDLDYAMTVLEVSTGAAGQAVSSLISSVAGVNNVVSSKLDISLGVTGTFDDPKVKFLGAKPSKGSGGSTGKSAVDAAKQRAREELRAAREKARQETAKRKAEAEAAAKKKAAEAEQKAKEEAKRLEDKAKAEAKKLVPEKSVDKAKDKVKGLLGGKKKKKNG